MKRILSLAAVTAVIAFHVFLLVKWMKVDINPPAWDQSIHVKNGFEFRDRFATGDWHEVIKPIFFDYPPLYHMSLAPFVNKVRPISHVGTVVNIFYIVLLGLSVYLIGSVLMGPWEGVVAAALTLTYPIMATMARETMIDVALTAWVAAGFYCLIKTENFENGFWSLLFGAVVGLGTLTKWTAFAYLLGPFLVAAYFSLRRGAYAWMIVSMMVSACFILPWYVPNLVPIASRIGHLANLPPASGVVMKGWKVLIWYPLGLRDQLNIPFIVLFIPGLVAGILRPKIRPALAWLVMSFVLFTLINNKNIRYTMPALPALALLSVAWVPARFRFLLVIPLAMTIYFARPLMARPPVEEWHHDEIIETVMKLRDKDKPFTRVLTIPNVAYLHSTSLNISLKADRVQGIDFFGVPKRRPFELADFILLKTGDLGPGLTGSHVYDCAKEASAKTGWFPKVFKEAARWPLPDGSEAILLQCRPDPVRVGDVGIFNLSLEEMVLPNVLATGVDVRAVPTDAAATAVGRLKELNVRAKSIEYKNLRFENVRVRLVKPQVNVPLFMETQEIQLLSLGNLEPHAVVAIPQLLDYAAKKAKWLKDPEVNFNGSEIELAGTAKGIPIEVAAELSIKDNAFKSKLLRARIGGVPIPLILLQGLTDKTFPLNANEKLAYNLSIAEIAGDGSTIRLGTR